MDLTLVVIAVTVVFSVAFVVAMWRGMSDRSQVVFYAIAAAIELVFMLSQYASQGLAPAAASGFLAFAFAYTAFRAHQRMRASGH